MQVLSHGGAATPHAFAAIANQGTPGFLHHARPNHAQLPEGRRRDRQRHPALPRQHDRRPRPSSPRCAHAWPSAPGHPEVGGNTAQAKDFVSQGSTATSRSCSASSRSSRSCCSRERFRSVRARRQGRRPEHRLPRRLLRLSSCSSGSRGHGSNQIYGVSPATGAIRDFHPDHRLRLPLRALDGLRGLPARPPCARNTTAPTQPATPVRRQHSPHTGRLVTSGALILAVLVPLAEHQPPTLPVRGHRHRPVNSGDSCSTPLSSCRTLLVAGRWSPVMGRWNWWNAPAAGHAVLRILHEHRWRRSPPGA